MTKEQIQEIWVKCPKAAIEFVEWNKSQIKLLGIPQLDEYLKKGLEKIEENTKLMLLSDGGLFVLYDFFDSKDIRVRITPSPEGTFNWAVIVPFGDGNYGIVRADENTNIPTRREVEVVAFINCFEILEERL